MKLAVLQGTRRNPGHLAALARLSSDLEAIVFRADPDRQPCSAAHSGETAGIPSRALYYDHQAGPPWRRLPKRLVRRFPGRPSRLIPFHEQLRDFDLIHTWELFTDWTEAALDAKRQWGIPVCVTVWDALPDPQIDLDTARARKARCLAEADHFLVHTAHARRRLVEGGVDARHITTIDPAVDLDRFRPGTTDRAQLGLYEDAMVLLAAGGTQFRKDADLLLLALRELVRTPELADRRFQLVLAGPPAEHRRLHRLATQLGVIDCCVFRDNVDPDTRPALVRSADVIALPGTEAETGQEQLVLSLVEALASGTPVLAANSGAIPDLVEEAGHLCPPNDFLALWENLRDLMKDAGLRRQYAERGAALARRRFSLPGYADRLADCYRAIQAPPPRVSERGKSRKKRKRRKKSRGRKRAP